MGTFSQACALTAICSAHCSSQVQHRLEVVSVGRLVGNDALASTGILLVTTHC